MGCIPSKFNQNNELIHSKSRGSHVSNKYLEVITKKKLNTQNKKKKRLIFQKKMLQVHQTLVYKD